MANLEDPPKPQAQGAESAESAEGPTVGAELFRAVFEEAADAIFVADPGGRYIAVNPRGTELTQYSREEILGLTMHDLIPRPDLERDPIRFDQIPAGRSLLKERRLRRKDGTAIPVEIHARRLRDGHLMGIVREIGERKKVEAQLRINEERFRFLAEHAQDLIYRYRVWPDPGFEYVSPSATRLTGYTPEEHYADPDLGFKLIHPEDRPLLENLLQAPDPSGAALLLRWVRKDGSVFWAEQRNTQIFDAGGRLVAIMGVARDVSERRQAEEAVRQSEERFRSIFEQSPLGISVIDSMTGRFLQINSRYCEIAGRTQQEMLALDFQTITHPDDLQEDLENMKRLIAGSIPSFIMEKRYLRPDGSQVWVELTVVPLPSWHPTGPRRIHLAMVQDLTKRKQAEEDRQRLHDQLFHAQKMESVGRLAGGVAHDFNNMLHAILGYTELALQQTGPGHPIRAELVEIGKAAQRSADLTRQLLAFARKQAIAPKVLDLNAVLEGMLNLLRRMIGEDITLAWRPGHPLWLVKIDPSQVDQILTNLCVNARDAIAGIGSIVIETANLTLNASQPSLHPGQNPGDYVALSVHDTGCGMDQETIKNIFEPFFTTKGLGQGTGLGLATVYGIVQQNGGFIQVSSRPGQGSTFRILLPRHQQQEEPLRAPSTPDRPSPGSGTVLLVEDDPAILNLGQMMLQKMGYTVLVAGRPSEALRVAETHQGTIHLLITDVIMPEMNGRLLAQYLKSRHPGLRCLFMSGYPAMVFGRQETLDEDLNFLQKPFRMQDLQAKVQKALAED